MSKGLLLAGLAACVVLACEPARAATATYDYDALGRLTKVTNSDGKLAVYRYDAAGNRSQVVSGTLPGFRPRITVPASSSTGAYTISWGTASGTVTAYKLFQATNTGFSGRNAGLQRNGVERCALGPQQRHVLLPSADLSRCPMQRLSDRGQWRDGHKALARPPFPNRRTRLPGLMNSPGALAGKSDARSFDLPTARGRARFLIVLAVLSGAAPVSAQEQAPPVILPVQIEPGLDPFAAAAAPDAPIVISPLRIESDPNDVNLVTGKTRMSQPVLAVPGAPNLRFDRVQNAAPYLSGRESESMGDSPVRVLRAPD